MADIPERRAEREGPELGSGTEALESSMRGFAALAFIAHMDGDLKGEDVYHQGINDLLDKWEQR